MKTVLTFLLLVVIQTFIVESIKVSPKLDFGEQSELIKVKKEIKSGNIKGLRVIVDTSELKESKSSGSESSSSSESSEKKKTVGVRTDVTFEITSGEAQNDTRTVDEKEIGKDDDNASVPIVPVFKGTPDRGSKPVVKDPNFNDIWSVKPLEYPSDYPSGGANFHKKEENNKFDVGDKNWKQLPQYAIWTTERYNHRNEQPIFHHRGQYDNLPKPPSNFIPYQIHHEHHHRPWQPCTCKEYPGPFITPQQSAELHQLKVDDKLDKPFSKTS